MVELTCFRITNPYEFFLGKLRNMTFTIFTLVTKEYKNIGLEITEQTPHLEIRVIYKSHCELSLLVPAQHAFTIWPL